MISGPCPEESQPAGGTEDAADFDDGLSVQQHKAIAAMLTEPTLARVADAAGVGERIVYKWLRDSKFRTAMFKARRQAFEQAISLTQRAPAAVATLVKIISDEKYNPAVRVTAAKHILDYGRTGIELADLAEQVDEMKNWMESEKAKAGHNGHSLVERPRFE